jgi:hypothetical protein
MEQKVAFIYGRQEQPILRNVGSELERVEFPRIVTEDFFDHVRMHVLSRSHGGDELRLLGRIVMSVVGAYEDVILPRVPRDVRNVLIRFAGDVKPVLPIFAQLRKSANIERT